jgi:hypothetical protein
MSDYKGLVYMKHGRVGSRSEGPDYFLQTKTGEFRLNFSNRLPFEPDYHLAFYCGKIVLITGEAVNDEITVEHINETAFSKENLP